MAIFYYLIFPGFLFATIAGLLTAWFDRKVTAKVQWRKGPPILQNFYDIFKLLIKEVTIPDTANPTIFLLVPAIALSAASVATAMLGVVNMNWSYTFVGDLIVLWYIMSIPSIMIIIGASASGNPLSSIGASREMNQLIGYELPLVIILATIIFKVGSIGLGDILAYQSVNGPILYSISGVIACIVMIICLQAKLGLVPFDIPEAETELGAGAFMEYSGVALGAFKLTKAILLYTSPIFIITLFWGGIHIHGLGILWAILKYVLFIALFTLIRNTNPRLRIDQSVRFFWITMTILALIAFILMSIGY
ncbi:NADH-quinone oxidoreductase subunit H [bacterium]|nr:NADH-quinone oxidoreductase subunit H [bacterium]